MSAGCGWYRPSDIIARSIIIISSSSSNCSGSSSNSTSTNRRNSGSRICPDLLFGSPSFLAGGRGADKALDRPGMKQAHHD